MIMDHAVAYAYSVEKALGNDPQQAAATINVTVNVTYYDPCGVFSIQS
jgi:hypothetical protein